MPLNIKTNLSEVEKYIAINFSSIYSGIPESFLDESVINDFIWVLTKNSKQLKNVYIIG